MYIGRVTIDDVADANSARKVKVNKKIARVAISAQNAENLTILDESYPYVVDLFDKGEPRGFKVFPSSDESGDESNKKILFILKSSDGEDSYDLSIDVADNDEHFDFILDGFFQGEYRYEVQDSAEALLKRYDPKGNGKIIALSAIALTLLFASLYGFSVFQEQQREAAEAAAAAAAAEAAQKEIIQPLSSLETSRLKRIVSKELLDQLKSDVSRIKSNNKLDRHASIRSITTNYEVVSDMVKLKGVIGYEYDYPVRETALASETLYTNTRDYQIEKTRGDLYGGMRTALTVSCVQSAMDLPSERKEVLERKGGTIKIKYMQMRPSDFLHKFRNYMDNCPAYIENVAMSEDKFELQAILYRGDEK